jgi:MarR family transcriptional regulator, organic hydroperoxide resistance regulator
MKELVKYVKETGQLLSKIDLLLLKELEDLLHYQLTPKQGIILAIVHDEGPITMNDLTKRLQMSSSSISQLVSKLEKEKFVSRKVNEENRREVLVHLYDKGIELYQKNDEIEEKLISKYYSKFSLDEIKNYHQFVSRLYEFVRESSEEVK